jgi:hypothetical protein
MVSLPTSATEAQRKMNKGTRGRGDKERVNEEKILLVSLSPCPLVNLFLWRF